MFHSHPSIPSLTFLEAHWLDRFLSSNFGGYLSLISRNVKCWHWICTWKSVSGDKQSRLSFLTFNFVLLWIYSGFGGPPEVHQDRFSLNRKMPLENFIRMMMTTNIPFKLTVYSWKRFSRMLTDKCGIVQQCPWYYEECTAQNPE